MYPLHPAVTCRLSWGILVSLWTILPTWLAETCLGLTGMGAKRLKNIYIYMPSTCCSLPAAEPLRSLGESCGAAGTSCQIACFQEGWQETGPLNPLGSPHPDLVCQCSFKFASSLLLYFIERSARWEHWQQLGQQSLFPVRRCPGAEAAARPVRKLSW